MAIELNNHMGLFHIDIELLPAEGGAPRRHRVLVDTGASYLALPRGLVASLGYQPIDHQHVVFATGQTATWEVAEVRVRLEGRERTVLAFLAPESAPSLLGAQTLETFGLGVDPHRPPARRQLRLTPLRGAAYAKPRPWLLTRGSSGDRAERAACRRRPQEPDLGNTSEGRPHA